MDFSDSDSDTGHHDWDKIHQKEIEKLELQRTNWGKNRDTYYNSDTQHFQVDKDDETVKAEEREIKMIQKEQAALLSKMDFGLDSLLTTSKSSKQTTQSNDNKKINKNKNIILTVEERVRQVLTNSPELLTLLSSYLTHSTELSDIIPVILTNLGILKEHVQIAPIVSLLKLRQQLLLTFCSCILFYLYLKTSGKNTTQHPVMSKLLAIQSLLESQDQKWKEIRTTLYEVQKLFIDPYEEYQSALKKRQLSTKSISMDDDDDDNNEMYDGETPEEYYNRIAGNTQAQKKARKELHQGNKPQRVTIGTNIVDQDVRRGIGKKIDKNTGLRRQKSKKQMKFSSTRSRLRAKHEVAVGKRKSTVREFKGQQGNEYTGEATIKKGLIRSVKLG